MNDHLDHLRRRNLRESTIRQRRYVLLRLSRFTGTHPLEASTDDLRGFLDRLTVPESRATETSHLRAYYRWAVLAGLRTDDPALPLERPRLDRRLPRPMPDDDLARALELSRDRVRAWLHFATFAGLRACEMASLRAENILMRSDPAMVVVDGKGGKMRAVPLHPELTDVILSLPKGGWCFPYRDGRSGHVPAHVVSHAANSYLHDHGIAHTLHTCRHWFATSTYRTTRDLRVVQELLGHASPATTQVYTWVDPGAAVEAVRSLARPAAPIGPAAA